MPKEIRKQKKLLRQQNREIRKVAFEKLKSACKNVTSIDLKNIKNYQDGFNKVWPFIKPLLEFTVVIKATNDDFDKKVTEVIVIGDNMFNHGSTEAQRTAFVEKLDKIWDMVEFALNILKLISNDQLDKIIDKIIEIGDWIFELDKK